ncbi:MAG TPA: L,D-transpeptidase [Ornithinibacter sp.]|nr:L,D-transpeptidase [Ornithinibacter sp.]
MRRRSKVLLTAALAVPMVLGGAGTAYAAHFQDRALPGSTLAGVSVAGMTREDVADTVRQRAADVTVTVLAGTTPRTVHLTELGSSVDVDATVAAVFAANESWSSYATSLVSDRDVDAVVRTDSATTDQVVAGLVGQEGRNGTDASVRLAEDKRSFVVTPAVVGQSVVTASFHDVVVAAARELSSATAEVQFVDTEPAVSTQAAQRVADQANALVARKVSVSDGEDLHTASARVKASWVRIPTGDGVLGTPSLDAAKVRSWVAEEARAAKVEAREGLRYRDSAGTVRLVRTEARDGRTVSNADAVASAVERSMAAGKAYAGRFEFSSIEAVWKERRIAAGAERLAYPAAEGEKWIDVDLGAHTMSAYVGAKRVYGPVKMVDGSDELPTVLGTFEVYLKRPLMTMRGNNADGTTYETPDVPWTSFFHRGYALHGAPWRSSFGYSASHGCVNLPVGVAKWVYDFAPIGTPVTVHR